MFCEFGCDVKLSQEIECQLSKESQKKFDEIQRLSYYFMVNATKLNQFSASELIIMSDQGLIQGSDIEEDTLKQRQKVQLYEELIKKDLSKGTFLCKCGSVVQCDLQQRKSADEGSTAFIECCNPKCGKRWKL